MALVTMKSLLMQAGNEHRGVGAFSVGNMEMVKGAVRAAEEADTPIILQIAEVRLAHSPLELMGPMMVQAAKEAKVDVAVHLDHGLTEETVKKALELGFTSVMYDSSTYPFEENIERTKEIVKLAGIYGATVEKLRSWNPLYGPGGCKDLLRPHRGGCAGSGYRKRSWKLSCSADARF